MNLDMSGYIAQNVAIWPSPSSCLSPTTYIPHPQILVFDTGL